MGITKEPCVSIIVPAYEAGRYIATCLKSLTSQTYPNVEIIVVYRRSSDNTKALLNEYANRVNIVEQAGKYPANARNLGILHCSGEYVAFCDADDVTAIDKVRRQVKFFERYPEAGVIYTDFFLINSAGKIIDKIATPEWDFRKWLASGYIAFSTLMVKKELLSEINLFDETLDSNEDFDLLIRLARITEFKRLPDYLSCRRIHESNLSRSLFKTSFSRSKICMFYGYTLLAIFSFIWGFIYTPLFYFLVGHPRLYDLARKIRGVHMLKA